MRVTLSPVVRTFGADDPSLFPSPPPAHSPPLARRAPDAMPVDVGASRSSFAGSDWRSHDGQLQPDDAAQAAFAEFSPAASLSPSLPDDLAEAAETLASGADDLEPALRAWLAPLAVEETSPASSSFLAPLYSLAEPVDIFGALAPDAGGAALPDREQLAGMARASLASQDSLASPGSFASPVAPPLCQERMQWAGEERMRLAFDIAGSDVVGITPSGRLQVCFQPALASCEPLYVDLDREAARALARQILQLDDDVLPDGVAGIFNAPW